MKKFLISITFLSVLTSLSYAQVYTIGALSPAIGTSAIYTSNNHFLLFNVTNPTGVKIQSVDVYPGTVNTPFTIVVQNSSQAVIASYTGMTTTSTGPQTVPVNFTIPQGSGYRFGLGTHSGMVRNSTGANYPYTVPGLMTITGNTFQATYYYFHYNIKISNPVPPAPNNTGVSAIVSPVSDCDGSIQNVVAEIENFGTNQVTTAQVHWSINSVTQTPATFNGLLDTANGFGSNTALVTLGSSSLVGGNSYNIVAWTEMPNNAVDPFNGNDTSTVTVVGYNYPTVSLGLDTTTCPNDPITLNAGSGRDSILWNTTASTQTIIADSARTYIVTVWKNGCPGGDTINVNFFPAPPTVNLGNDTMICYGDSIMLDATASGVTYVWHDNSTGPTYYADTVGNYSVTIEDANTCKNTDDINVSLFSTPLISMSVIPRNTLCFGSPFEFRANSFTQGSTMYQWKINTVNSGAPTSNNKFSPSLMYGDSVNVDLLTDVCSSTTYAVPSNYITMYLKPEPILISGSAATDTVLENTTSNYLVPVVQGSTFTWSAIGGAIASPIGNAVSVDWGTAMDTAKIMVEEKDAGNCRYTNVRKVFVMSIVGVKDENNLVGIGYAYPNPANTSVTIPVVIEGNWNIDLSLYDITGKKVKSIYNGEVSGNRDFTFAVDDLDNGMYFYKISTQDGYESVKKLNIAH